MNEKNLNRKTRDYIAAINAIENDSYRRDAINDIVDSNNPYDLHKCKTKYDFSKRHIALKDILEGVEDKNAVMGAIRKYTGYPADDMRDMSSRLSDVADQTRPGIKDRAARALYGVIRFIPLTGGLQKKIMEHADVAWIKYGYGRIDQGNPDAVSPLSGHREHSGDRKARFENVRQQYQNGLMEGMDLTSSGSIYQGHHRDMVAREIGIQPYGIDMGETSKSQSSASRPFSR